MYLPGLDLSEDLFVRHPHEDRGVVEVNLNHAARLSLVLVMEGVEVEEGPAHAGVYASKDVGLAWDLNPPVEPYPHREDAHAFEIVDSAEHIELRQRR
eukprot:scaffold6404_cov36-Prasinocladus_malaysianus.AAC.1